MKSYKILYTAPTIGGEFKEVNLMLGEEKAIDGYSVKLSKVLEEPSAQKTGSCTLRIENAFGRVKYEVCTIAKPRGGYREGAGRKVTVARNVALSVRITQEAMDKLNSVTDNKAEFIDNLIKAY